MSNKRIFYGWAVVGAAVVGLATGWAAIGVFSFGAFIKPLEAEFGWHRGEVSLGLVAINLTGIFMAPLLGMLVDRHGVRKILLPSCLLLGVLVASFVAAHGQFVPLLCRVGAGGGARLCHLAFELFKDYRALV